MVRLGISVKSRNGLRRRWYDVDGLLLLLYLYLLARDIERLVVKSLGCPDMSFSSNVMIYLGAS